MEDQEQKTPSVFLAAMLEITLYQNLRVKGKVKGRTIMTLIDSGGTRNFITSLTPS